MQSRARKRHTLQIVLLIFLLLNKVIYEMCESAKEKIVRYEQNLGSEKLSSPPNNVLK